MKKILFSLFLAISAFATANAQVKLVAADVVAQPGETVTIPLSLANADEIAVVSMKVAVSEGLTLKKPALASRLADNEDYTYTMNWSTSTRALSVNSGSKSDGYVIGNGELVSLKVAIPASFTGGTIEITDFAASNLDAVSQPVESKTYTIHVSLPAPKINFTCNPADGSTVEKITKVFVTFPDYAAAGYDEHMSATITNAAGESASSMVMWGFGTTDNSVAIETMPITTAGTYTFTLPAGSIQLGPDFENLTPTTQDITFTLTVGSEPTPVVTETAKVEFSLPYRKNTANVVKSVTYTNAEGNDTTVVGWPTGQFAAATGHTMTIQLDEENYQIDSVLINDVKQVIDHSAIQTMITEYTSVEIFALEKGISTVNFTTTPTRGSIVEKITKVYVTFPDYAAAGYDENMSATITNAAGESASSMVMWGFGTTDNSVAIETIPITTAGTYTFTLPAGSIQLGPDFENLTPTTQDLVFTLTVGEAKPETAKVEFSLPYRKNTANVVKSVTYTNAEGNDTTVVGWPTGLFAAATGHKMTIQLDEENYQIDSVLINNVKQVIDRSAVLTMITEYTTVEIFAIEKAAGIKIECTPAAGSTVEKITKVFVTFPDYAAAGYDENMSATITNAAGESASSMVMWGYGTTDNSVAIETMPITTAGTYTFTLPAGSIQLGPDFENLTPTTEDITFTIKVAEATGISAVNAKANAVAGMIIKTPNYIIKNGVKYNYAGQMIK